MAWTTPGTATAGDVLTAAFWNTQVRDNMNDIDTRLVRMGKWEKVTRTSDISFSNTTWADLDTNLDITLAANAGDVIEVGGGFYWGNQSVNGYLDVVTVVSGSPVNSFGSTGGTINDAYFGIVPWVGLSAREIGAGGNWYYKLLSGDVSGGNVLLRLRRRCSSAVSKSIYGSTSYPITFFARNNGPDTT